MRVKEVIWSYAEDKGDEVWRGECATRLEAIAEARAELDDVDVFYVRSGNRPMAMQFVPDAKEILEMAAERAGDEVGEGAEDWPDVSETAKDELDTFLVTWAEKYLEPVAFWVLDGTPERIEAAAPEETKS